LFCNQWSSAIFAASVVEFSATPGLPGRGASDYMDAVLDLVDIWTLVYPDTVGLAVWIWCGSKHDLGNLRAASRKSSSSVVITCSDCDGPYRGGLRTVRFDPERRISIPKYLTDVQEITHYNNRCFEHSKPWLRYSFDFLLERARDRRPRQIANTTSPAASSAGGWNLSVPDSEEPYTTVVWFTFGMQHRRRCPCSFCEKLREERRLL